MKEELLEFFKDAFSIKYDTIPNREIKKVIKAGIKVKGTNVSVLLISIVIACIGLNTNSIPIVIGAMLISPLMNGIMAIGYGYATKDNKLLSNALLSLVVEVTLCILTSAIYFLVSPIQSSTPELLSRISPTFYDVLIAIFGGLAGIIGLTRKDSDKGNVVPGVAIATALIPPLCTSGYGLATGQLNYFLGALYLFVINLFFIVITTYLFIKIMKLSVYDKIDDSQDTVFNVVFIIIAVIIVVLPTIIFTYTIIQESLITNEANEYISNEFDFSETQVINSKVDLINNEIDVVVVGKTLTDQDIDKLIELKSKYNTLVDMQLKLYQNDTIDSVTESELNDILEKYSSDVQSFLQENEIANDIEDELKVKKIEELEIKIEQMSNELKLLEEGFDSIPKESSQEVNLIELWNELISLNDTITDISYDDKYIINDNGEITKSITIYLNVNDLLVDDNLNQVKLLIAEKFSNENITIIQNIN